MVFNVPDNNVPNGTGSQVRNEINLELEHKPFVFKKTIQETDRNSETGEVIIVHNLNTKYVIGNSVSIDPNYPLDNVYGLLSNMKYIDDNTVGCVFSDLTGYNTYVMIIGS
jgi:hypothetical protein